MNTYKPIVGEAFYPIRSFDAVKTGRFNSEVKILAGVNADEGSIFVARWFINLNSSSPNFKQNVINILDGQMKKWKNLDSDSDRKKIIDFYLTNVTEIDMIKNRTGQVFGDYVLTCPTYYMAKDMMLWSGNNKVYFYKLTHHSRFSFSHGFIKNLGLEQVMVMILNMCLECRLQFQKDTLNKIETFHC